MTFRAFTASLALPTLIVGTSLANAQAVPQAPSVIAAQPAVQLVQKNDDKDDKDKKGKKGPPGKQQDKKDDKKDKGPKGAGGPPPGNPNAKAQQLQQQKAQQAKDNALKQKQQADQAKQNAFKAKQQQIQQAKDNALKQKQQADKAKQDAIKAKQQQIQQAKDNALKQKQQGGQAKQDAIKEKQQQIQQAKDKALQQKQQADKAKQDAIKEKQQQIQQAKDNALKQKQQADKARQDAFKQKQLEVQQAKEKLAKEKQQADKAKLDFQKQRFQVQTKESIVQQRQKFEAKKAKASHDFEKAREQAKRQQAGNEKWRAGSDKKFEDIRKGRKTREVGSRNVIIEKDKRVIVYNDNRTFIRHDESRRFQKVGRELRRERRKDGTLMVVTMGLAGALIYSLQDDDGRLLRRSRRGRDGRDVVLIDNRRYYGHRHREYSAFGPERYYEDSYVDLPPPVVRIPREKYVVEYENASADDIYDALDAPPIEPLERGYSLDEVRQSYGVLERMRRVDLDTITFDFGSWDVGEDQYGKLERIANAMQRILDKSPGELFLIEGHTDAVGSDIDNLSLSDRRAESVAVILSETFKVPPENLTTQGYGEEHLKVQTEEPSRINRRVSVRRITPLLSREGWDDPD